jgi:hypothetical protein
MSTNTLFQTEGLLLKNNFRDVPNKTLGLTNILTDAFGDYRYSDISIINGMHEYGRFVVDANGIFTGAREYGRLKNIELNDLGKPAINNVYSKAAPFQTIKNQVDKFAVQIGQSFSTGGGDGLLTEYFRWRDVYGDEPDIKSKGGGTFVSGQESYFNPNTAVAPSDSEAFYEFDAEDLDGAVPRASEITWGGGIFNFGAGKPFHPTIEDTENNNAGIVKFSGYFNPGNFDHGDGGNTRIGSEYTTDRILITTESSRFGNSADAKLARTTIPIIIKFWDVDQTTGEQITSNSSPSFVARFAPSLNDNQPDFDDDIDGDGKTDGTNPPSYYFVKVGGGGINDQYQSPNDVHQNNSITNINSGFNYGAYVIAPIQDGRMPSDDRIRQLNPFKPNTFYRMEMYFILGPRVASSINTRTVFLEGYDRFNSRPNALHKSLFWSENPLNFTKYNQGKLEEKILYGVSRFGTNVAGNATRIGSIDSTYPVGNPLRHNTPSFKSHIQSIGVDSPVGSINIPKDYKRLFSDQRLLITYKPPHVWNEIKRGTFIAPNFGVQSSAQTNEQKFHKYHYVAYGLDKDQKGGLPYGESWVDFSFSSFFIPFSGVLPRVGNLLIDSNSPKPRASKGGDDGSVFDSFTYIKSFDDRGGSGQYAYLSKPVTGIKKRFIGNETGTPVTIVDNIGLKGYGCGRIKVLPDGRNKLEIPGLHNLDCPRTFYDGEVFGLKDIIIFEDYNDTPFIQISDTSPGGTYVTMKSSNTQVKPGIDGLPPVGSARSNATVVNLKLANDPSASDHSTDKFLGKNFFVYHHKGLVDKSLDSYCILPDVDGLVIEAKATRDTETTESVLEVDRNDISTYSGSRMVVPDSPRKSNYNAANGNDDQDKLNDFNVWGKFIDVNGTRAPNNTVINEYLDYKHFPRRVYTKKMNGTSFLKWELRMRGYNCPQVADVDADAYGALMPGDHYFQAAGTGNESLRLVWNRTANKDKFYGVGYWKISDGANALVNYSGADGNRQVLPRLNPTSIASSGTSGSVGDYKLYTNSALDSQTHIGGHDSPDVPVGLSFHDGSTGNLNRTTIGDVVKAGFGVTICKDASKAKLKYQCFKPTNTAPPFLATSTGLRTIPEGLTDFVTRTDAVNSVKVSYASPGAGSNVTDAAAGQIGPARKGDVNGDYTNAPVTTIICTSFKFSGSYGNNSPGINNVPIASVQQDPVLDSEGKAVFFEPGGIIKNDTDTVYNRQIEIESITEAGDIQRFHLLGTTHSGITPQ